MKRTTLAMFLILLAGCETRLLAASANEAAVPDPEPTEAEPEEAAEPSRDVEAPENAEPRVTAESSETAEPASRGAQVFATHCATCHGPEGRGDGPAGAALEPPAADLVGPRAEHLRGIPRRTIIAEGRPGTAMVGWKDILSPEDLEAVYGFVHEMKHGPGGMGPGGGMGRGGRGGR